MRFKKGDIIQRPNKNNYSHANIYSGSFVVGDIKENNYVLQQANFYGFMDIKTVDNIFTIDESPKGYVNNIREHILYGLKISKWNHVFIGFLLLEYIITISVFYRVKTLKQKEGGKLLIGI